MGERTHDVMPFQTNPGCALVRLKTGVARHGKVLVAKPRP